MTQHELLALIGISVSGYADAELDELLAAGVANRIEPAEQSAAKKTEAAHRKQMAERYAERAQIAARVRRFRLDMAGARWRSRRAATVRGNGDVPSPV